VLIRYINVTSNLHWLDHAQILSAAAEVNSSLTGRSGVKMSGPYSWVMQSTVLSEKRLPENSIRYRPPISTWMTDVTTWEGVGDSSQRVARAKAQCPSNR
jgi:hypothetical protein